MKLLDKETLSIADAVSDVLKNKTVKEISYPHKMYSPDGEEVTATNKEEHEAYSAKGYSHDKPVKEETISETTIKSSILQNADWDGRRDSRENPDKLTIQQFIRQEAKKYNIKVKFQKGKGSMQGQPSDLAIFDGSTKDLIDYFNEYYDARMKNASDLKAFGESLELEGKKFKWKFNTNEELSAGQKKLPPALQKAILKKQGKKEEVEEPKEEETEKQKKYQAFFQKALKKYGVKSPAELEGDKKKEFFNYIDKNYKSTNESVRLQDQETLNIAKAVRSVIQKEAKYVAKGNSAAWGVDVLSDSEPDKSFPRKNVLNIEKATSRSDMKGTIYTIRIEAKSRGDASSWIGDFLHHDPLDANKNWRELLLGGPVEAGSDGVYGSDKKGKWIIIMGTKRMLKKLLDYASDDNKIRKISRSDYPGIL